MAFTSQQGLKHGLGRMYPQPPLDKGILVNGTGGYKGIQSLYFLEGNPYYIYLKHFQIEN